MKFLLEFFSWYAMALYIGIASVGPIALGGLITAILIAGPLSRKSRPFVVLVSVALQAVAIPVVAAVQLSLASVDPSAIGDVTAFYIPFSFISAAGFAAVWIPLGCEPAYLLRARTPRPWLTALVGVGALLGSIVLVWFLGGLMGAGTN